MKIVKKLPVFVGLTCSIFLISCTGGFVTHNGFLENGQKEFKESLVGKWQIILEEQDMIGPTLYEFYKDKKRNVKLRVNGLDVKMEGLNSFDGMFFDFKYADGNGKEVSVFCNFRSYAKNRLVVTHDTLRANKTTDLSAMLLGKMDKPKDRVVVDLKNN